MVENLPNQPKTQSTYVIGHVDSVGENEKFVSFIYRKLWGKSVFSVFSIFRENSAVKF